MSANRFAAALRVPTNRITEILAERRALTADTAMRLARALGTSPEFWLNLQKTYELREAELEIGAKIKAIKPIALPATRPETRAAMREARRGGRRS
jgi:addiction module HigA family antidote